MMDKPLRRIKDQTLYPVVKKFGGKLHPTTLTLFGTVFAVLAALSALMGWYSIGLAFWLLNRLLDGLDGAYARIWDKKSDLGGYLDTLSDFLAYTIIPFGFVLHDPTTTRLIILAFLFGTFYINAAAFMYLAAILERESADDNSKLTSLQMPRGIIEGGEAIIFFCAFFLFPHLIELLFLILSLLVIATTCQHIIWSIRNLK